jgi:hypothetical protein
MIVFSHDRCICGHRADEHLAADDEKSREECGALGCDCPEFEFERTETGKLK